MPIYTYMCESCGLSLDINNTVDERDHPTKCPCCGGKCIRIFNFSGGIVVK
jgi:putative FmdB family regulatory protein